MDSERDPVSTESKYPLAGVAILDEAVLWALHRMLVRSHLPSHGLTVLL